MLSAMRVFTGIAWTPSLPYCVLCSVRRAPLPPPPAPLVRGFRVHAVLSLVLVWCRAVDVCVVDVLS